MNQEALAPSSVFTKKDSSKKYDKEKAKAAAIKVLWEMLPKDVNLEQEVQPNTLDKKIDTEKAKAEGIKALQEGMQIQEE